MREMNALPPVPTAGDGNGATDYSSGNSIDDGSTSSVTDRSRGAWNSTADGPAEGQM